MKPAEAKARAIRVRMLVDAWQNLDGLYQETLKTKAPPMDGDYRAMTVDVESCSDAGGTGSSYAIELDLETAQIVLARISLVIEEQLRLLGVEPR